MSKVGLIMLALLFVFLVKNTVLANENHGGEVRFDVKWTVQPRIVFIVTKEGDPGDYEVFINGKNNYGTGKKRAKLDPYIFEERMPGISGTASFPYVMEEVDNEGINDPDDVDIFALVASNDWWKLEFQKPRLVSNNDHYTTIPVYAKRSFKDIADANWSETSYFAGNDYIQKDMGVYLMRWDLLIKYYNYRTRYGKYKNTFKLICTQF